MNCAALISTLSLLLAGAVAPGPSPPAAAEAMDVAVIVHPDVPVESLRLAEVRKIFLGDQHFWRGGQVVSLLIRKPVSRERNVLLQRVCEMSEQRFRRYWKRKVFAADADEHPTEFPSNELLIAMVKQRPGSITLVAEPSLPRGVKVLKIEGMKPGDDGYPLR